MLRGRPSDIYHLRVSENVLVRDPAQVSMLAHFDAVYYAVQQRIRLRQNSFGERLRRWRGRIWGSSSANSCQGQPAKAGSGLYLYGQVGRGKSQLMNILRQSLPGDSGVYFHFHELMAAVHRHFRGLEQESDPLDLVVERIVGDAHILYVDEFVVVDIADAMIMSGLLDALFGRGIFVVTTSNFAPGDLYRDGLQRDRFKPAVEQIKTRMRLLEFSDGLDYRRQKLSRMPIYIKDTPVNAVARLNELFYDLTDRRPRPESISLSTRAIKAVAAVADVAWFRFDVLCGEGRSRYDYQELAMFYSLMIIDGIKPMDDNSNDLARRFIYLIDIFYESKVKVVLSSTAAIDGLYSGDRLADEFARTVSRLGQMCSEEWLERPHLCAPAKTGSAESGETPPPERIGSSPTAVGALAGGQG